MISSIVVVNTLGGSSSNTKQSSSWSIGKVVVSLLVVEVVVD